MRYRIIIRTLAAAAAAVAYTVASFSCANTSKGPSGGPKDTIPPVVVGIAPEVPMKSFPVNKGKIVVTFNEYVQLKNPYQEVLLSPPTKKKPQAKIKKKSVVVTFEDTLKNDQTYTLLFGQAISDVNEGNQFNNYSLMFSTGEQFDSLIISGTVMDYATLLPQKGMVVALYLNPTDSCLIKTLPDAVAKTDDWGYFCVQGLKGVPYSLYALEDKNNNQLYDRGGEKAGFCDTTITPDIVGKPDMPQIKMMDMKDTLACLSRPSQTDIYIFKETLSSQYIENSGRISERECFIKFRAANPQIDTFRIKGVFDDRIIRQFNPEGDSLTFWINDQRPVADTLFLRINYMKTDSTGKLVPFGENIKLVKPFDKSQLTDAEKGDPNKSGLTNDYLRNLGNTRGDRNRNPFGNNDNGKKDELEKPDKKNQERKDLLKMKLTVDGKTVENRGIELEFPTPLIQASKDSITFTSKTPRGVVSDVRFTLERDSSNMLKYNIQSEEPYKTGNEYKISIKTATFKDINSFTNDSTFRTFSLPTDDKLCSITLEITGTEKQEYIVELVNEKRDKVFLSHKISGDCNLLFPYLNAGVYSFRITQDVNHNGKLDVGDIVKRIPPEKARLLKMPDGKVIIKLNEQTDLTQSVDLKTLFR